MRLRLYLKTDRKCSHVEKLSRLRRVTLPSKKGDPARRVTFPANFLFFAGSRESTTGSTVKFCKQNTDRTT